MQITDTQRATRHRRKLIDLVDKAEVLFSAWDDSDARLAAVMDLKREVKTIRQQLEVEKQFEEMTK